MTRRWILFLPLLGPILSGCPRPVSSTAAKAPGNIRFRNVAKEAGLTYRWTPDGKPPRNILQTIGHGCAFLDYDRDGNLDILLVGNRPALFKGDGHGKFQDVTSATLGNLTGHFLGCAVGDLDGDDFPDVYLSGYREGRLLRNEAGKRFKDATAGSGTKPQPWGTSCAFGDLDGDGRQDLVVGNYAEFDAKTQPQLCRFKTPTGDVLSSCGPANYKGLKPAVYRNDGGGRFTEVSGPWGFGEASGRALGVALADLDGSGRLSVALANDEAPGDLFVNQGGGKFVNEAEIRGVAYDAEGAKHGGMGIDWGDYDNDGRPDLFVATFENEVKNLYRNEGDLFSDRSTSLGITGASSPLVAFGCKLFDADNDGFLDLIVANGHVQDNIAQIQKSNYRQELLLYRSIQGKRFERVKPGDITGVSPIVGRGLAIGDYNNDGKTDCLFVDDEGAPILLENNSENIGKWFGFTLPISQIGAKIIWKTKNKRLVFPVNPSGSYLSSSDCRVKISAEAEKAPGKLSVVWNDGREESLVSPVEGAYQNLYPRK